MSHHIYHRAATFEEGGGPTVMAWLVTREGASVEVPAGVSSITYELIGAGGAGAYRGRGGGGGRAQGSLAVTPGETLTLAFAGGGPGGGGSYPGGDGGAAALLKRDATTLAAGAGGGGGGTTDSGALGNTYGRGGAGGGASGLDGQPANAIPTAYPGAGGTASAGGAGGTGGTGTDGTAGSSLQGGAGGTAAESGGGGGGGYYGGGGGEGGTDGAGGGGGSSLGDTLTAGNDYVPGDSGASGAGVGGNGGATTLPGGTTRPGAAGLIRLTWQQPGVDAPPAALALPGVRSVYVPRWQEGAAYPPALVLQAGAAAGLSAGDPVPRLIDWAGGLHLDQGTLANQPTVEVAGTPDGVAALYLDGTAWLDSLEVGLQLDVQILAVWQPTTAASFGCLVEHGDVTGGADGVRCNSRVGAAATLQDGRRSSAYGDSGTLAATPPAGYLVVRYVHNVSSAARHVYVDGVDVATPSGNPGTDYYVARTLRVGARLNGSTGAVGYLRGMAILDGSASAETIAAVTALLEGAT